jgi:hypothetical protein
MLNFTTNEAGGVLIIAFEPTDEINYDWQSTHTTGNPPSAIGCTS